MYNKDLVFLHKTCIFARKLERMASHTCFLCMGSNTESSKNLQFAREWLQRFFPDIRFGEEMQTEARTFYHNRTPFLNQTGRFHSDMPKEEIVAICKHIERLAGRTQEDKSREIVKLDIDLLQYDHLILKPEDMKLPYVNP